MNSLASKKQSVQSASMSKSTTPFAIAEDAERNSITQCVGIQRPRPLQEFLTVPVLGNRSGNSSKTKPFADLESAKKEELTKITEFTPREVQRNTHMQALRPSQDFSFDNDHINEEAVARTKQLYHKLP